MSVEISVNRAEGQGARTKKWMLNLDDQRNVEGSAHRLNVAFTGLVENFDAKVTPEWLATPVPQEAMFVPFIPKTYRDDFEIGSYLVDAESSLQLDINADAIAPVGEYGKAWSEKLLRVTEKLLHGVESDEDGFAMREEFQATTDTYGRTLVEFTSDGEMSVAPPGPHELDGIPEATERTFFGGFESIRFAALLATMYKQEGYEDAPERLLKELVTDGVISDIALTIPANEVGDMQYSGKVLRNPVIYKSESGRWRVDPDILHAWSDARKEHPETTGASETDIRGCPAGRKLPGAELSGVDTGARLFVDTLYGKRVFDSAHKEWNEVIGGKEYMFEIDKGIPAKWEEIKDSALALHEEALRPLYTEYQPEGADLESIMEQDRAEIKESFSNSDTVVSVWDPKTNALVGLTFTAPPDNSHNDVHLNEFATWSDSVAVSSRTTQLSHSMISSEYQGHGIGTRMTQELFDTVAAAGIYDFMEVHASLHSGMDKVVEKAAGDQIVYEEYTYALYVGDQRYFRLKTKPNAEYVNTGAGNFS